MKSGAACGFRVEAGQSVDVFAWAGGFWRQLRLLLMPLPPPLCRLRVTPVVVVDHVKISCTVPWSVKVASLALIHVYGYTEAVSGVSLWS